MKLELNGDNFPGFRGQYGAVNEAFRKRIAELGGYITPEMDVVLPEQEARAQPMKQSTMRLRSVTLKRRWLERAKLSEICTATLELNDIGFCCYYGSLIAPYSNVVYLPKRRVSHILPTSGPE